MPGFQRLVIRHTDKGIVQHIYIATLYVSVQVMRFVVVLSPNVGVVSLQVEADLEKHFVPEPAFNGYTMSGVVRYIESGQQDRNPH